MAVVNIKQKWSPTSAEANKDGRSAVLGWSVLLDGTDDPQTAAIVARQATGIPRVGDPFVSDFFLRARRVMASPVGLNLFDVLVNYEAPGTTDDQDNPLDMPAKFDWGFLGTVVPVENDADGNPLVNAVGEPFDPPITSEVNDAVLRITRNQATIDIALIIQYYNVVSSDGFLSDPGQAKMASITAASVDDGAVEYWTFTYEIHFRRGIPLQGTNPPTGGPERAWYKRVLNQGFRVRVFDEDNEPAVDDDGAPIYRQLEDDDGKDLTSPVLLTADGKRLPDGADPVWAEFKMFDELPFGPLGLI